MKLSEAVASYVAHKQAMGMCFYTEKKILKSFCRNHGAIELEQIQPKSLSAAAQSRSSVVASAIRCLASIDSRPRVDTQRMRHCQALYQNHPQLSSHTSSPGMN